MLILQKTVETFLFKIILVSIALRYIAMKFITNQLSFDDVIKVFRIRIRKNFISVGEEFKSVGENVK